MKPAILLLAAAAVTVTGCRSRCDVSDLALYWTFSGPAGNQLSCADAGVASVRITIDEQPPFDETVSCTQPDVNGNPTQGILLTDFVRGFGYGFQLEGLDAAGGSIYLDQFTYTPDGSCGADRRDRALTSTAGDMNITYSFQPAADCTTPTPQSPYTNTFIWLRLVDQDGIDYSVDAQSADPRAIGCGLGNATILIPNAPFGQYRLSGIEEIELRADNSIIVYHYNCNTTFFQHAAPGDVFAAPPMIQQAAGGQVTCF